MLLSRFGEVKRNLVGSYQRSANEAPLVHGMAEGHD